MRTHVARNKCVIICGPTVIVCSRARIPRHRPTPTSSPTRPTRSYPREDVVVGVVECGLHFRFCVQFRRYVNKRRVCVRKCAQPVDGRAISRAVSVRPGVGRSVAPMHYALYVVVGNPSVSSTNSPPNSRNRATDILRPVRSVVVVEGCPLCASLTCVGMYSSCKSNHFVETLEWRRF